MLAKGPENRARTVGHTRPPNGQEAHQALGCIANPKEKDILNASGSTKCVSKCIQHRALSVDNVRNVVIPDIFEEPF